MRFLMSRNLLIQLCYKRWHVSENFTVIKLNCLILSGLRTKAIEIQAVDRLSSSPKKFFQITSCNYDLGEENEWRKFRRLWGKNEIILILFKRTPNNRCFPKKVSVVLRALSISMNSSLGHFRQWRFFHACDTFCVIEVVRWQKIPTMKWWLCGILWNMRCLEASIVKNMKTKSLIHVWHSVKDFHKFW